MSSRQTTLTSAGIGVTGLLWRPFSGVPNATIACVHVKNSMRVRLRGAGGLAALRKIKADLHIQPVPSRYSDDEPEAFDLHRGYDETALEVDVPLFYGLKLVGGDAMMRAADYRNTRASTGPRNPRLRFAGTLYPEQIDVISKTNARLQDKAQGNSGLIIVPPGAGKTVLGLKLGCDHGRKFLVIVSNDTVKGEWVRSIAKFVPDATVTFIQGEQRNTSGDVVIAMIQTLYSKTNRENLKEFDVFSLVIVDEAQNAGARVFSQTLLEFSPECRVGLTATPKRSDQVSAVVNHLLGTPIVQREEGLNWKPGCVRRFVALEFTPQHTRSRLHRSGKPNLGSIHASLVTKEPKRNRLLMSYLEQLLVHQAAPGMEDLQQQRNARPKTLILAFKRDQVTQIARDIVKNGWLAKKDVAIRMARVSAEELEKGQTAQVIVGTFSYCSVGMNITDVQVIVFASPPQAKLKQVFGRGGRGWNNPDSRDLSTQFVAVVDIQDTLPACKDHVAMRTGFALRQNFQVVRPALECTEETDQEITRR